MENHLADENLESRGVERKMLIKSLPTVTPKPKFRGFSEKPLLLSTYHPSLIFSNLSFTSLKCHYSKNEIADKPTKWFSALPSVVPWETGSLWSTLAFYMFNLHIPLGYGGMSIIAYILHQPVLDPQTKALSLFVLESLELTGTFLLLRSILKPKHGLLNLYKASKLPKDRNWLLASALGFTVLIFFVFLTSILADRLYGTKDVNNPVLKEMLLSSDVARVACVLVYCIIAPLLEETVYRGFLLRSLASRMKWQQAVAISATIFSAAHFSGENFLQLFIIGWVLGCSYCWTGDLRSSIVIHSLYNAFTLMMSLLS